MLAITQLASFGAIIPVSEIDAFTMLMLHCDGADASTTFTDSSAAANTVTANGNAQIDTAQSKFGGASALFDGTGDYLSLPSSDANFALGTGDFTIDFWLRFNSTSGTQRPVALRSASSEVIINILAGTELIFYAAGVAKNFGAWSPSTGTWYHMAVTRSGTGLRMFIDGTQFGSTLTSSENLGQDGPTIGGQGGTNSFNGWIDELRISKGIARWTANFTPPTAPYA